MADLGSASFSGTTLKNTVDEGEGFSLCGKAVVAEADLRDEYYWKLVADFIGPQSGEGLELEQTTCKNRLLIQVGLMREENNFPWLAIVNWLKNIFPRHHSADFRRLIERGIATTLSLGIVARLTFMASDVNFNFVGPICDSIGVERPHLLEMRDFSERAQSIEVTNGLILELSNFVTREKLAPVIIVTWLRNFNPEFCKNGNIQSAYKILKSKIKKVKFCYRNYETRSHRRNAAMENLLQSPFELVPKKAPIIVSRKRMRRDYNHEKVKIKEEYESFEIMPGEGSEMNRGVVKKVIVKEHVSLREESDENLEESSSGEEIFDSRRPLTLLDITMMSVHKLSRVDGGKTAECKKVSLDLLKNHFTLACKVQPAMAEFVNKVNSLSEAISLVSPVNFIHYNANFLVDVHDAVEQHILNFEKEITLSAGEKLGRDKLPKFKGFVNLQESATSRYIHMASDILSPRNTDWQNSQKHWIAFCEEKNNPSKLTANQSNKFNNYFEAAAGLIHHHKEVAPFFSDVLSLNNDDYSNVILESVAADASDSMIQSLVCVLAIIYCKILGPYWQLMKSGGEFSLFGQYMLRLYQRFLDWSKDPSTLLEPEEITNVFLQCPSQEKTFDGVFHYCGQWHTNRDLIKACLKRAVKVIAGVTEEHLKDFLPGGKFSQLPSPDLSLQLASCTFSVLMEKYPVCHTYSYKKKRSDKSPKHSAQKSLTLDSSQEEEGRSGSLDYSSDESCGGKAKKNTQSSQQDDGSSIKRERSVRVQEETEENMDSNYITSTVRRNGGPCMTQQDVDKMMLRFDGKPRLEKREAIRCEILYQKMILNNTSPHLNSIFHNSTEMVLKLKLALPRLKPGFSLVLAPKKTKPKKVFCEPSAAATEQKESSSTGRT
ncbi:uncharacterized protein [Paralichthys olivaceus]|uniref:uncharacterized protein n=1 Tax=Paralichthys olivaceus TaxID=8255 RepID=UPI00097D4A39|nr:PREDICTED: uncharacterized protein LOC109640396 [Paralichthys olivaceus]XP_019959936.1 PREDICTED: uncharacterized protein LOC109640396 [Paralichthys olivaceus]XP_019959938.1 PREDICTED: uncharacterized protein LOC109640396 [Paralichthys olivaceus]